jgi:hypothetical protein
VKVNTELSTERQKLARVSRPASTKPVALPAGSLGAIRDAFVHE